MLLILSFISGSVFGGCVGFFAFALASMSKKDCPENKT